MLAILDVSSSNWTGTEVRENLTGTHATPVRALALTVRDPITIDGNADFTNASGVIRGSGTESDPYIIEGWLIDASLTGGGAGGITISHTDAYFEIRDVVVRLGGNLYTGIWLSNVNNGTVQGSLLEDNYEGITLNSTRNMNISDNRVFGNDFAGIYMRSSDSVNISANEISNATYGVYVDNCTGSTLSRNNISDNTQWGIIVSTASEFNRIWNNTFVGNNGAVSTYDPSHIQAYDDGTNSWWNSTDGYGNYWSDWTGPDADMDGIVDEPYLLDGSAGAMDYYPLTTLPSEPIPEFGIMPLLVLTFLGAVLLAVGVRRRKA